MSGLQGHHSRVYRGQPFTLSSDGGRWRCGWCECKADECTGKGPGPHGNATLCANCSGRYRNGATGAVKRDDKGNFLCDCGRAASNPDRPP